MKKIFLMLTILLSIFSLHGSELSEEKKDQLAQLGYLKEIPVELLKEIDAFADHPSYYKLAQVKKAELPTFCALYDGASITLSLAGGLASRALFQQKFGKTKLVGNGIGIATVRCLLHLLDKGQKLIPFHDQIKDIGFCGENPVSTSTEVSCVSCLKNIGSLLDVTTEGFPAFPLAIRSNKNIKWDPVTGKKTILKEGHCCIDCKVGGGRFGPAPGFPIKFSSDQVKSKGKYTRVLVGKEEFPIENVVLPGEKYGTGSGASSSKNTLAAYTDHQDLLIWRRTEGGLISLEKELQGYEVDPINSTFYSTLPSQKKLEYQLLRLNEQFERIRLNKVKRERRKKLIKKSMFVGCAVGAAYLGVKALMSSK